MKKSKFLLLFLTILILASALPLPALALDEPEIAPAAAVLMDADSGEVFYSVGAHDSRDPASTTKIMTALLVIEAVEDGQFSLDDSVAAYDDCQQGMDEDSSNANPAIEPGEILSIRDLLYCAMLASANEACNILAEYTAGSIDAFVDRMNERAKELGCTDTKFRNPNGLENANHYSSAYDLALIARECVKHTQLVEICSAPSYGIDATNINDERTLRNSNKQLNSNSDYYNPEVYGLKTGYFETAGYCLVSAMEKDEINLIAVVLGEEDEDLRFEDANILFDWFYENFAYVQVLSATDSVIKVPVQLGVDESVAGRPEVSVNVLLPNDFDMDSVQYEYVVYSDRDATPLIAPVNAGTILGEVTVSADGREFGTVNIVATNTAELSRSVYLKNSLRSILQQPVVRKLLVTLILVVALYLILVFFYLVQRARHVRSLREARQSRVERQAMRENFSDVPLGAEEPQESEFSFREFVSGLLAKFKREDDDEDYDEDDEN